MSTTKATDTDLTTVTYTEVAAGLRGIAEDLQALAGMGLPAPYVSLTIQPGGYGDDRDDAVVIAAVDAVARALVGVPGTDGPLSGGLVHRGVDTTRGGVQVWVFDEINDPATRQLLAKVERLRAELATRPTTPTGGPGDPATTTTSMGGVA
jgi:hypothetical protein